ncbi:MAG: hypothetical protein H6834_13130 [Planctomycetes bacterium]|nr:hypothetical protein [Planctomycetota bacterium]
MPKKSPRDAIHLGDILGDLVPPETPHLDRLRDAFLARLEPEERLCIGEFSERRGTIRIPVSSSCLLYELRSFRQDELLSELQATSDTVTVQKLQFELVSEPHDQGCP